MNKNDSPVLYDLISMALSVIIIVLTVIEVIDIRVNQGLLPYVFLIGGIWSAFGAARYLIIHRRARGYLLTGITILLFGISVSSFIWR